MSKMLSRNLETRPPHLNLKLVQPNSPQNQVINKRFYGRSEFQTEPTSVLDIRSPSPTSTLSCSFGASTDGALFRENVCDVQPLDYLNLMDSKDAVVWQIQSMNGNADEFQPAETENANANVSMGMEDLESILLESPSNESNNNSQLPCLMGEGEYPMHEIKAEPGLQQPEFNETMDTHFSEDLYNNTEANPLAFFGDMIGNPLPPYSSSAAMCPLSSAFNIHFPNPTSQFSPDFNSFKMPMDEKPLHLPYNATQTYPEKNVIFSMPDGAQGYMGTPYAGFPDLQKSLQWQQLQHQDVQPSWKGMIHRGFRNPLLPTGKAECSPLSIKCKVESEEVQDMSMVKQLLEAAKCAEIGSIEIAQAILARLNQYLSPHGKPLQRASYYLKEALSGLISLQQSQANSYVSPFQLVQKISACKTFSEYSPISQFATFTANQVLLEALENAERIHIIDFDMGIGGQWASFLQEIALRPGGPPALRLTAVGHESMEMHLIRDNLCSFAEKLNIPFTFQIVEVPQNEYLTVSMLHLKEEETVAVNYSLWMQGLLSKDFVTNLLNLIKQIYPKVVVVVDNENEQNGASFAQKYLEALHFYALVFESLEVVNMNMESVEMIEKFVMAPRICDVVESAYKRQREGEKLPYWRNMFISAGFSPLVMSNFTQKQAEFLSRNRQLRFGHCFEAIKKQQEQILLLGWQRRALVSVSAWRCNVV
ncbi:GRAS family protein RAM1 [Cryptomeria japonica]|uniref:GRAS family protein RAM1 n=1 Tax=Cryptomeria japonica TaxID=3369 RepID=UPI0025ACAE3E|nr:GRAS family protein RAM1 [Cryptomeria japonica]XP_057847011.1 GRAS family protein RAM1 [Cryptomeria japonica]